MTYDKGSNQTFWARIKRKLSIPHTVFNSEQVDLFCPLFDLCLQCSDAHNFSNPFWLLIQLLSWLMIITIDNVSI